MDRLHETVYKMALTPSPLRAYRPPVRELRSGRIVLGQTGAESSEGWAVVFEPIPASDFFAMAADFFGPAKDFALELDPGTATDLAETVAARGWRLVEDEPALALMQLPAGTPSAPAELEIVRVATNEALADFLELSGTARRWIPSLAAAVDPAVALLVGYVEGMPVATARVAALEDVAEIAGVMTHAEYRRNGYGTALTWAAINAGRDRGCTAAALTATEMGYPVYRRMGFQDVCRIQTFMPP